MKKLTSFILSLFITLALCLPSYSLNRVQLSPGYFPNPISSKALSNADIYVGEVDLDPEVVANRKQVSVLQENGTIVAVSQPIKTGLGGTPVYNGSPVTMLVDGSYSLKVVNSYGAQVYYVPSSSANDQVDSVSNIAGLRSIGYTPSDGAVAVLLGHTTDDDGGQGIFHWDSASVDADNNGTIIAVTGVAVGRWIRQLPTPDLTLPMFGGRGNGTTDNYAAFVACKALKKPINIGTGVWYFSQKISTSTAESDAIIIKGSGFSQTVLAFDGTSGVELLGTGDQIQDLSICDRSAYATPVTTLTLFHSQLPAYESITAGTVGLLLARNNIRATNVQSVGFDAGIKTDLTKFYMAMYGCRSHYNLRGFVSGTDAAETPNFCHAYSCYFSSNFLKNVEMNSGFMAFTNTSIEKCGKYIGALPAPDNPGYDINNANFPNGGVYIAPIAHAIFNHCYLENSNFYNFSRKTIVKDSANMWNAVLFAPTRIQGNQFGTWSKNLILPAYKRQWVAGASTVTFNTANTNLDDDKRFVRVTSTGGAGVVKTFYSHKNANVRGLTPRAVANIDFKVYVGFYVRLVSGAFSSNTFFRVQFEDTAGATYYGETPVRTLVHGVNGFDTTSTDWQYVGAYFAVRNTLATGVPLANVRLEITMEDAATDYSVVNGVMDIAEPELKFYYQGQGHEIMDREPDLEIAREKTMSGGIISVVDNYHTVDTEGDAATDDLDTISGDNLYPGFQLVLQAANSARTVVVKDGTGNININGDFSMDNTADKIILIWNGASWDGLSQANNGA